MAKRNLTILAKLFTGPTMLYDRTRMRPQTPYYLVRA